MYEALRAEPSVNPVEPRDILIVSSIFPPHIFGGAEVAAFNRAKLLAKRGHRVSVMTLREKNTQPAWGDLTPDGYRLYRITSPRGYTLFERAGNRGLLTKMSWHLHDYLDESNVEQMGAVLDDAQPDHVDIDNIIGIGFNALAELTRRDIPTTYILHDLNLACFNTGMCRNGKPCRSHCTPCRVVASLRQRPLETIPRLGFISPSFANLESARKVAPIIDRSLSRVIRNAPEDLPGSFRPTERTGPIRLLFAGRLDPVKGIELLMRTLDALDGEFDFRLTVLGTGPLDDALRARYGRRHWVSFRGFVPRKDIGRFLIESDLYCIPSLVSESYGLVTAQALHLGTPVIGSRAGGTAELVRDGVTGMLVPPGDERAWRDAFRTIFSAPALTGKWRGNALRFAEEFDEDRIAESYEDFISLLANKTAELRAHSPG